MAKTMSRDGRELEVDREMVEVTTNLPQPDPEWSYTDRAGHAHAYGSDADRYPTLVIRSGDPYWCDDCQDDHTDSWFECPLCGEKITPGTRIDSSPKFIPGATAYYIDGRAVSRTEGEALLAEMTAERERAAQTKTAEAAREEARETERAMRAEGFTEEQIQRVVARMTEIRQP
ncbi:hypothetical protein ABZ383_35480 [Streptomyces sp. NPDC005900]|uniref:hypothetical protein n=1 Tax=Streptomyces sp. NPDC005900 TaxID=3154569 RepID=UPI003401249D